MNPLTDRAVYDIDGRMFAKVYTPDAGARFRRERAGLELASARRRSPEIVHTEYDAELGGLIVKTALGCLALAVGEDFASLWSA